MDRFELAPLSFGQLAAWRDHRSMPIASRKDLNSLHVVPAPPGTSRVAAVEARLVDGRRPVRESGPRAPADYLPLLEDAVDQDLMVETAP